MEKIAMKCNSKQFKHIKPKLKEAGIDIFMISEFKEGSYLCFFSDKFVTNGVIQFRNIYAKIYDEWNEETFLKICGIKPKEKTYKITREQIKEIHGHSKPYGEIERKLKEWFPEVFETKLTVGKWYKKTWKDGDVDLFPVYEIVQNGNILDKGNYFRNGELLNKAGSYGNISCLTDSRVVITEATEQEVKEALTKEAVRLGFKQGVYFKIGGVTYSSTSSDKIEVINNCVYLNGGVVFEDGKWAEVIPTITIKEAEAKLKCKIV